MASEQGKVGFDALGKRFGLRFGMNALCALEDEFGVSVAEMGTLLSPVQTNAAGEPMVGEDGKPLQKPAKLTDVRRIFRAGLESEGEHATLDQAGDIIDALGMERAVGLVGEAFSAAFPDAVSPVGGTTSGNRRKK